MSELMAQHTVPGEWTYDGMVLGPILDLDSIKAASYMDFVSGDILVASYPKTGTTWMSEILRFIFQDVDSMERSSRPSKSPPYIEWKGGNTNPDRPALLKTHLKGNLLPNALESGKGKVIVTIRNPKDTLVSLYHFYRMNSGLGNFAGTWDEFFEMYKMKHMLYGDFFDWYDSWSPHLSNKDHIRLVKYEDMKKDLEGAIREVAMFLGKDLSQGQIKSLAESTSFSSMRPRVTERIKVIRPGLDQEASLFMRKGEIGDWKNYFSEEQSRFVDEVYQQRLERNGFDLEFE